MTIKTALILASSCIALAACEAEQTQEGDLPSVDVDAAGGQLPEYNVEGPDVDVGTENTTVQVPTVDVDTPAEGAE